MDAEPKSYRARWLFPVDGPPLEDAVVTVQGDRIVSVETDAASGAENLGYVALIPGLVNSHTHLEFSDLAQPLEPSRPFADWIRAVIERRNRKGRKHSKALAGGYKESTCTGTTLLGEIATTGWSPDFITENGPHVVAFHEVLGLQEERIPGQLAAARAFLDEDDVSGLTRGLSPHAPYSVHPELYHSVVELAVARGCPLAIHLAETRAELELLAEGRGELVGMLDQMGLWREGRIPPATRPLDYLEPLASVSRALVLHGNYLAEDEIAFLASNPHIAVVYCPRTHARFGHEEHPWLRMLDDGVSVVLGTDSRASNPDLSLWKELQFLYERHRDADPERLLEIGTIAGARALGRDAEYGSITAGKRADLVAVAVGSMDDRDPYAALFDWRSDVLATMQGGHWVPAG